MPITTTSKEDAVLNIIYDYTLEDSSYKREELTQDDIDSFEDDPIFAMINVDDIVNILNKNITVMSRQSIGGVLTSLADKGLIFANDDGFTDHLMNFMLEPSGYQHMFNKDKFIGVTKWKC